MKKYADLIQKINTSIVEFNTYLKEGISLIKEKELDNQDYYMNLTQFSWEDDEWINSGKRGVYFIFGIDVDNRNNLGLYIGKASMNSYFGGRFSSHLGKYRKEEQYLMGKRKFAMEMITTIPIEEESVFLAPALEEFLIEQLKDKVHLINITGK